jgi:deoxyadenosine/deoxycytidine kinase
MGSISSSEWTLYNKEFNAMKDSLEEIDLFILLKCELQENISRIKKRGRSYDEAKDTSYLISLEQKYMKFQKFVKEQMPNCRVLEIDTTCMTPVEVLHLLENYIFSKYVSDMQPRSLTGKFGIKC